MKYITMKLTAKELHHIKSLVDTTSSVMNEDEVTTKEIKVFDRVLKRNNITKRDFD
tara:strand:+ start:620 stop:787 length:168 start_codon:yes stop_codon:yes gene_type:complete